jgi:hypothetical protein
VDIDLLELLVIRVGLFALIDLLWPKNAEDLAGFNARLL